ncbi:SMP-30/gluconolactonase/LRE family protein [Culicoidibacter larvae]|uniref:SMP-30/gluconolactonase/LRE family protein n=1 Tax=Culicoidibacter larvae TaxID=2579976 RepID=A0A5R8Q8Q7_9FIRM|nr:SMP-30/gluconolactonase/LRE family protein [Culicoidibacter larvae]TLG71511.1 SMP-30/gluconolactonase/LRE family protein [Culicoidibacter larvae]
MSKQVELLSKGYQFGLTEGPQWNERERRLYFIDATHNTVNYWQQADNSITTVQAEEMVTALAFAVDDSYVVGVTPHGAQLFDLVGGNLSNLLDPEAGIVDNRFNDGKVGPDGNFWAGTISAKRTPTAALYCFYDDQRVELKVSGVHNSNGLGWSPDGKTFYHTDTTLLQVFAYDFDVATSTISNQRVCVDFNGLDIGKPDGLCVDSQGHLWIGHWAGGQVSVWNPMTGEMLESIAVPAKNVTSCTFGGDDLQTLFITTAQEDEQDVVGGQIYCLKTQVKGLPMARLHDHWLTFK